MARAILPLLLLLTAPTWAADGELAKVRETFAQCLDGGSKLACAKQAHLRADAVLGEALTKFFHLIDSAGATDSHAAEAAKQLIEAQRGWYAYRPAQCHFLAELNHLEGAQKEAQFELCMWTEAEKRYESLAQSVWK